MGLVDWLYGLLNMLGLYKKRGRVVFLGLDNAGKTTLMHILVTGELGVHNPTVHPTSEELDIGGVHFTAFDLGGHEQARRVWADYTDTVDAVIFMLDASDRERASEARNALDNLLVYGGTTGVPFLVLGNKTDIGGAMSEQEVRHFFGIKTEAAVEEGATPIALHMCSLLQNEGYAAGFKWIAGFL